MGMAILLPGRTGYGKTPTGRVYARRSVSTSQRAVRRSRPSPWRAPTSCTPSGRPLAPLMSGTLSAGTPHSVHSEQNAGSPVEAERHAERGHAAQRPQRAECGVAGGGETGRRDTRGRGREQGVVFLLEQLGEAVVEARDLGERLEVAGGGVGAPSLDARAQPLGQTRAALVPLAREIDRDFRL